jgi:hypothetical protein
LPNVFSFVFIMLIPVVCMFCQNLVAG